MISLFVPVPPGKCFKKNFQVIALEIRPILARDYYFSLSGLFLAND